MAYPTALRRLPLVSVGIVVLAGCLVGWQPNPVPALTNPTPAAILRLTGWHVHAMAPLTRVAVSAQQAEGAVRRKAFPLMPPETPMVAELLRVATRDLPYTMHDREVIWLVTHQQQHYVVNARRPLDPRMETEWSYTVVSARTDRILAIF